MERIDIAAVKAQLRTSAGKACLSYHVDTSRDSYCYNCPEEEQAHDCRSALRIIEQLEGDRDRARDSVVEHQRHRDAWRGYAYGNRPKPHDFLSGDLVDRPTTRIEQLEANTNLLAEKERELAQAIHALKQEEYATRERAGQAEVVVARTRTALHQSETLLGGARKQISDLKIARQQAEAALALAEKDLEMFGRHMSGCDEQGEGCACGLTRRAPSGSTDETVGGAAGD